jgi:CRISPR/Cas system-associated endonuclease Cas1
MMNYVYAVLESQVCIATVSKGLASTVGYLHACHPGRVALVYDLMEPLRRQMDCLLLGFVRSYTFSPNDFVLGANGVCRVHPQFARQLASCTVSDEGCREPSGERVKD